jgi:hypothetical protein
MFGTRVRLGREHPRYSTGYSPFRIRQCGFEQCDLGRRDGRVEYERSSHESDSNYSHLCPHLGGAVDDDSIDLHDDDRR